MILDLEYDIEHFKKEYGKNWYRQYNKYVDIVANGRTFSHYKYKPKECWTEWEHYQNSVNVQTEEVAHLIPNIDNRGINKLHIDHKISKHYGYKNNIPTEHISHISNLHMISSTDNLRKSTKNIIDESNSWIIHS